MGPLKHLARNMKVQVSTTPNAGTIAVSLFKTQPEVHTQIELVYQ